MTQKHIPAFAAAALVVLVAAVLGVGFAVYLGARLTIPVARRVPIGQGERFQLKLPAAKLYKVEVCSTARDCLTVASRVRGPGPVDITFPTKAPVGAKMSLRVSERRPNGTLGTVVRGLRQAFLVRRGSPEAPPPVPLSAGGSSGADGGRGSSLTLPSVSNIRARVDRAGTFYLNFDTSEPVCAEVSPVVLVNGQDRGVAHHFSEEPGPPPCPGTQPHQAHSAVGLVGSPFTITPNVPAELRFVYGGRIPGEDRGTRVLAGPFSFQTPPRDEDRTWSF